MITIELTNEDATFLGEQLAIRCRAAENELVHTDQRAMQSDLARDLAKLERIQAHVAHLVSLAKSSVAV